MLLFAVLLGCQHRDTETVLEEKEDLPSQEGWDSRLIITQDGRKQAVVNYGHMTKYKTRRITYFDEGVEVDFYNRYGEHTSHLTSNAGEYHENTENVTGIGNVVVVSDSGTTLHTERLYWHQRREKIYSDTLVMVTTTTNDTLYGIGFESEPDLSQWIIKEPWGVSERRVAVEEIDEYFKRSGSDSVITDSMAVLPSPEDTISVEAETKGKTEPEDSMETGVDSAGVGILSDSDSS